MRIACAPVKHRVPLLDYVRAFGFRGVLRIAGRSLLNPILLPQEAEGVSGAFAAATAIQLLVCMLSVFRGKKSDSPHGLTKITVTN